jgi:hypothetical protein
MITKNERFRPPAKTHRRNRPARAAPAPGRGPSTHAESREDGVAPFLVVVGLFLAWGAWFIYRTSFVIDGVRYFCLFDDAMISMTYAKNVIAGYGLNWARFGEPVEGFTHPLWTFAMIPINALPIGLPVRSLAVQIVSLVALALNLVAVRALVLRHFSTARARYWLPAVLLTAFYYPLNHWALRGMETGLQALLTTLAVHLALNIVFARARQQLALGAVLAAAALLRPDMLLLVAAVLVFVAAAGGLRRGEARQWLASLAILALAVVGYGIFRWLYFHELLPNTYYLKLTGVPAVIRMQRGWLVFADAMRPLALPLGTIVVVALLTLRSRPQLVLPLVVPLLYFGYSIYVGGDVWEFSAVGANRFVSFAMPLVFVVLDALLNSAFDTRAAARRPALRWTAVAAATAICWLSFNGLWFADRAGERWRNLAVSTPPLQLEDHIGHVQATIGLRQWLRPDALLAVVWAGIPSYFSDYRMADLLGYNDRTVAHGPAMMQLTPATAGAFQPGHMKWNYEYLLGTLKPDLVFETWPVRHPDIPSVMGRFGYVQRGGYWVREGSPNVTS